MSIYIKYMENLDLGWCQGYMALHYHIEEANYNSASCLLDYEVLMCKVLPSFWKIKKNYF